MNRGSELGERRGDEQNIGSETDGQQRRSHRISSLCGRGSGLHCTTTQATSLSPPFDLGHDTSRTFRGQKARHKQGKKTRRGAFPAAAAAAALSRLISALCMIFLFLFLFFCPFKVKNVGALTRSRHAGAGWMRRMMNGDDGRGH